MTTPRTIPSLPPINEKAWLGQVCDLARLRGWKIYHTHNSIHSPAGFPDLVMCRPPRLVFAELKTDRVSSKLTVEQREWLHLLADCELTDTTYADGNRLQVYVWRPSDFDNVREVLW